MTEALVQSLGDGRDDMESDRALKRARSPPTSASKHRSRQVRISTIPLSSAAITQNGIWHWVWPSIGLRLHSLQMAEPESSRGSRMRSSSRPEANTRRHEDLEAERHGRDLRDYLEQKKQRVRRPGTCLRHPCMLLASSCQADRKRYRSRVQIKFP